MIVSPELWFVFMCMSAKARSLVVLTVIVSPAAAERLQNATSARQETLDTHFTALRNFVVICPLLYPVVLSTTSRPLLFVTA